MTATPRFVQADTWPTAMDPETLAPRAGQISDAVILVAAHLGETRLIDNLRLGRTLR